MYTINVTIFVFMFQLQIDLMKKINKKFKMYPAILLYISLHNVYF
jgi:hypothetical protein